MSTGAILSHIVRRSTSRALSDCWFDLLGARCTGVGSGPLWRYLRRWKSYVVGVAARQHKIQSGFGAHTTAAEVLRGVDLMGRRAVFTGGYSGIGLETTRALADAGAHVVVPARRRERAEDAVAGMDAVDVDELDLADLASVHGFADRFLATGRSIDILINNAGIMASPETRVGPGWEAQFATNHLGHYKIVNRLWPALTRDGARVVPVSSNA